MPKRVEFRCTRCERKKAPHCFEREGGVRRSVCRRCEENARADVERQRARTRRNLERLVQGTSL